MSMFDVHVEFFAHEDYCMTFPKLSSAYVFACARTAFLLTWPRALAGFLIVLVREQAPAPVGKVFDQENFPERQQQSQRSPLQNAALTASGVPTQGFRKLARLSAEANTTSVPVGKQVQ